MRDTFDELLRVLLPASETVRRVEGAVRLHQLLPRDASGPLQGVDVLRVVAQEEAFLLQQADHQVRGGGAKLAREQLAGQVEERLRVLAEIVQRKNGLKRTRALAEHNSSTY